MENSLNSLNVVRTRRKSNMFLVSSYKWGTDTYCVWDPALRSLQTDVRRESFIPAIVRETNQIPDCYKLLAVSKDFYSLNTVGRGNMRNGNDKQGIWCEGKEDIPLNSF